MKKRFLAFLLAVCVAVSMLVLPASAVGSNAAVQTATALGVPVLAKLPLDPAVNTLVDAGRVEDVQRPELQDFIDVLKGYGD